MGFGILELPPDLAWMDLVYLKMDENYLYFTTQAPHRVPICYMVCLTGSKQCSCSEACAEIIKAR